MVALIIALLEHPEQHAQVKSCLELAGHEVLFVDTFTRAKSVLKHHVFDLIISDVHLENGGSVFDFLKWVKSDPTLQAVPFVLFSLEPSKMAKYLADGVQTAARAFGAAMYISMDKFDGALLAREIAELLPPDKTPVPVLTKEGD